MYADMEFFSDNFFVITSENCDHTEPNFYGYAFTENEFVFHCDKRNQLLPTNLQGISQIL